jgi:monoamine oxidase
MGPQGI